MMEQLIGIAVIQSTRKDLIGTIESVDDLWGAAESARDDGDLIYYACFVDLWSMGNSFAKYLPEAKKVGIAFGERWIVDRDSIVFDAVAEGHEEAVLRDQLNLARTAHAVVDRPSIMIVVREILSASSGLRVTP